MKRNNEAHFNQVPNLEITRSRFKRDQDIKLTFDAGQLIPFYVDEVLPGDTFSIDNVGLVRMSTPIFPVMDNCYLDYYYFFCPNRILWEHWKEFMGEVTDEPWVQQTEYTVPQLKIKGGTAENKFPLENSILDYMGVPTKIIGETGELDINALPIRAYVKIWNEWFRDQNVDNPAINSNKDADVDYKDSGKDASIETILQEAYTGGRPLPVNRFHDYFSSTLPSPQRSAESVTIPMMGNAPVKIYGDKELKSEANWLYNEKTFAGGNNSRAKIFATDPGTNENSKNKLIWNGVYSGHTDTDQIAYMGADLSAVTGATINQLRQAFQVQKYFEELARGGSRYREQIYSLFRTRISDKTVQIPEYLGGDRIMINMNQVIQTSGTTETSPQGNVAAMSVTGFGKSAFTKSFEEHGFVIGVCCVRHDHTYQQGLERMFSRKNKLDYYFPVFANLGEQAVLKKELYAQGTNKDNEAFGYQEAWADYRMKPNRICGAFRSNATGTLDSWHYGDNYTSTPALSQEWMKEGSAEIARTLAVENKVNEPQFIADLLVKNTTVRPMPMYSVPGLIDHH
nr:major capsid protein [Microviridae sp.]